MDVRVIEAKPTGAGSSPKTLVARAAILAALGLLAIGCSSKSPQEDRVTLSTGQGVGADPVTVDYPIFYVKRPVLTAAQMAKTTDDVRQIRVFDVGADLFMRSSASPSALETNLTASLTNDLGDVRDVDVSFDGKKVVFAMRFPKKANAQEKNQPGWGIWEYTVDGTGPSPLHQLTSNVTSALGNDRFPHYLPDGRIVFSSTRQRTAQAILLDENKPQYHAQDENNKEPASVLHVMDATGGNIHQISFNQSHDLDSAVLPNGRIVFSRWDGATDTDAVSLYSIKPDGSDLQLLYGRQACTHLVTNGNIDSTGNVDCTSTTTTPIQFLSPRPLQNGKIMALIRPFSGTEGAGDLVYIDSDNYVEYVQPTLPNVGILNGPAETRVSPTAITTEPKVGSLGGRFRSAYPLADNSNRLLVSWSQCRIVENDTKSVPCTSDELAQIPVVNDPKLLRLADPLFGIYIYDLTKNTQLPIVVPQEGVTFTDVVAAAARTAPPVINDPVGSVDYPAQLESQSAGVLDIKSVYDFDGVDRATAPAAGGIPSISDPTTANYANRTARFLRIEKAVSLPDKDTRDIKGTSFGPTGRFMREVLGYAPIEPDGSVRVRLPANVAIQISVVDSNARAIGTYPRHRNWLQLKPGEVLTCNGCHTPGSAQTAAKSHGRPNLFAAKNAGAPASGLFPGTDPALQGIVGDTMAFVRAKKMCPLVVNGNDSASACQPSVDVIFDDLWTLPAAASHAAPFDYCYSAGPTDVRSDNTDDTMKHLCVSKLDTATPVPASCETNWSSICRIVINYVQHIQPLWDKPRLVNTVDMVCTSCHSPTDAMGAARVPAGQLDLTSVADDNQPDHIISYEKLVNQHRAQELNGTMLRDICVLPRDPTTGACPDNLNDNNTVNDFVQVDPSMLALNARGSRFFTAMNDATHAGLMTATEKRLISEWLDIGAQYFNDPFLAPVN